MSDPIVDETPGLPFEFLGETFHMRPIEDYQWELLVFADAAVGGADAQLLASNAATLRLIKATLAEGEWPRFAALASRKRAQTTRDLMPVVVQAHFRATARPTPPPSDSSDGRPATPQSSEVDLYSRVIEREEATGRLDRGLLVLMKQEAEVAGRSGI